jgi:hypothetical protein
MICTAVSISLGSDSVMPAGPQTSRTNSLKNSNSPKVPSTWSRWLRPYNGRIAITSSAMPETNVAASARTAPSTKLPVNAANVAAK